MAKVLFAVEIDDNENIEEFLKNFKVNGITECGIKGNSKFNDSEVLLTANDIKEYFGIGNTTAYSLFKESDFPSYKIKGRHVIRKDLFLKYVDSHYGKRKYIK